MKIVCISDTHLQHLKMPILIPDGDVLIHAGDATMQGTLPEVRAFSEWFGNLPHKHKIFVAGNHDWSFQMDRSRAIRALPIGCIYLEDSEAEIEGVRFWGSPWQPWFFNWAFNLPRGDALVAHWDRIPEHTDVLITHSPPYRYGDWVQRGENVGCEDLLAAVERIRPRLHVFGHIHDGYGRMDNGRTEFINACLLDEKYNVVHAPIVVEIESVQAASTGAR